MMNKVMYRFLSAVLHAFSECFCTHQFQAECAPIGRGVVHSVVTMFVPHSRICVVPQQILHTPDKKTKTWFQAVI